MSGSARGEQKKQTAEETPHDADGPDEDGEEEAELARGVVGQKSEQGEHAEERGRGPENS